MRMGGSRRGHDGTTGHNKLLVKFVGKICIRGGRHGCMVLRT